MVHRWVRRSWLQSSLIVVALLGIAPQRASACPDIDGLADINCDFRLTILAFGDSITRGEQDSQKLGYPGRLKRLLPNARIYNLGKSGESAQRGRSRARTDFHRHRKPDYIIIMEGVNDWFAVPNSIDSTRSNLYSIRKTAADTGAIPLLAKLTQARRGYLQPWISNLNGAIRSVAVVDFYSLGSSILSADRLHPDGPGYAKMAARAHTALRKQSSRHRPRDRDKDGLYDFEEPRYGTSKVLADSDGDGLKDGDEIFVYGSNPLNPDSDGDGINDGAEVTSLGTDPLNSTPSAPRLDKLEVISDE